MVQRILTKSCPNLKLEKTNVFNNHPPPRRHARIRKDRDLPEYLLFNLPGTRQSWRIKLRNKKQEGVLKSKGVIVYEYNFDDHWCKYRKVKKNGSFPEWMEPEFMSTEMREIIEYPAILAEK